MPLPAVAALLLPLIAEAITAALAYVLRTVIIGAALFGIMLLIQKYYVEFLEIIAIVATPVLNFVITIFGYDNIDMGRLTTGLIDVYRFCKIWIPLDFGITLFTTYIMIGSKILGWRLLRSIIPKF